MGGEVLTERPHNLEAEEAVIGAVFISPDCLPELNLNSKDFYIVRHGWIWDVFLELSEQHSEIDLLTVRSALEQRGQLSEVGGPSYLTRLITQTPSAFNAPAYAKLVKEASVRRAIIDAATRAVQVAYDNNKDIEEVISTSETALLKATSGHDSGDTIDIKSAVSDYYDLITYRSENPDTEVRMPTKFIDFDRMLGGGLKSSYALMIAGEPGKGKTILATQSGVNMAESGHPGIIYSMEMTKEQLINRIVSWKTGIDERLLETGKLEDRDWPKFTQTITWLADLPLHISDSAAWSTSSLRANLMKLQQTFGIKWFVLDYFRLLTDTYGKSQNDLDAYISRRLKFHICKPMDLCGIIIHTLNKAGMDNALPGLKDLSGSGQISYDMDAVMFINDHIPSVGQVDPALRTITMEKNRFGNKQGSFDLVMLGDRPALANAEVKHLDFDVYRGDREIRYE